jgi:CheY-like chemotaxis protein
VEIGTVALSTKQVLCVDDTRDDCELFKLFLGDAGYDVKPAQSFTEAVQLMANHQFDLCLFDISIPGTTGFELLTRIRSINPSMPVILCTADASDATREEAMQAGIQAFFTKPIDFDLLIETIAQLLHPIQLSECYASRASTNWDR